MRHQDQHAFTQLITLMLITFSLSGGVLGTSGLWLRYRASESAKQVKDMQAEIARLERQVSESRSSIAAEEAPNSLLIKNREMHLGLAAPVQIIRIGESPEQRLAGLQNAARPSQDLLANDRITFQLAGGGR